MNARKVIVAVAAVSLLAGAAQAVQIAVPDYDMELDTNSTWTTVLVDESAPTGSWPWEGPDSNGNVQNKVYEVQGNTGAWYCNYNGASVNPICTDPNSGYDYSTVNSGLHTGGEIGTMASPDVLTFQGVTGSACWWYQTLNHTYQEGYTYTFRLSVGRKSDGAYGGYLVTLRSVPSLEILTPGMELDFFAASTALAMKNSMGDGEVISGTFSDVVVQYTATASDAGKYIVLSFAQHGIPGGYPSATQFDNARLDVVPEPAALSLLGVGGVLLLKRRRGK